MPQAVAGASITLSVIFHAEFVKESIEQFPLDFREYELVRLKIVPVPHPFERNHRTGHGLAIPYTAFTSHGDVENLLVPRSIGSNVDIA